MTSAPKRILVLVAALTLGACATDDPNERAKIGAAVGAVAGAVIGHQAHHDRGKYVGAAAGAAAGAAIGNYMDKQQQALEEQLAAEQRSHQIELERVREDTIKLNLSSEVSFDYDSAALKPSFYPSLDKIASVISQHDQTSIEIVGHTDSRGSEAYNQRLSEQRAESVANYLIQRGVSSSRITTSGRGELEPRGTNSTEAGRQLNRRVEIFLRSY
jgi:outer membrane protein OmpA-like peptidoglycan-associated protein